MKTSSKFYTIWATIFVILILLTVAHVTISMAENICKTSADDIKMYHILICILYVLFLVFVVIAVKILLDMAKPFPKIDYLNELEKSKSSDTERIKKFCDTLVEL